MNPAENNQMMIVGQVVQRADDGVEPFIAADKAEDPDELCIVGTASRIGNRWRLALRRISSASLSLRNDSGWSYT